MGLGMGGGGDVTDGSRHKDSVHTRTNCGA
jgi:hypothetical protein